MKKIYFPAYDEYLKMIVAFLQLYLAFFDPVIWTGVAEHF